MRRVALAISIFFQTACVTLQVGSGSEPPAPVAFTAPAGWEPASIEGTTHAFRSRDGAVMGLSTACDDNLKTLSLEQLTEPLISGVTPKRTPQGEVLKHPTLLARETRLSGTADGRPVEMMAIVLKSADCVHDLVLTAGRLNEADRKAALAVAATLREVEDAR